MSNEDKLILVDSFSTSDPNLSSLDPEYHRGWFALQSFFGKILRYSAPEPELEHIRNQWLTYFAMTAESEEQFAREKAQIMNVIWPWLKTRLKHNRGLVKFMREYGVYSRYFVPLLRTVPGAWALCVAHGECPDIFGRIQKIPRSDKIYHFAQRDEMFAFARLRKEAVMPELEKTEHAMILGAGTLQEVRQLQRFSAELLSGPRKEPWLVAYDSDETLKDYYAQVLDEPLTEHGVDFHYSDFREGFADPKNHGAYDCVAALGVASYYDLKWFLGCVKQMLMEKGVVIFDLQVLDGGSKLKKSFWQHTLVFDNVILRWESDMRPQESVAMAVSNVEVICAELGLRLDYYMYDPHNQIGVIFQVSR